MGFRETNKCQPGCAAEDARLVFRPDLIRCLISYSLLSSYCRLGIQEYYDDIKPQRGRERKTT